MGRLRYQFAPRPDVVAGLPTHTYMTKLNPYLLAAIPALLLVGRGAYGAQLAVLGVTLGIFFGTLSLRRPGEGSATTTHH